jgi:hypothetical protein
MSTNNECRAARESALAIQTAPLTPAERADLRSHLASCEACRVAIGRLDDIIDAASTLDSSEWANDDASSLHDDDARWGNSEADDLFARIEGALDDDVTTEADDSPNQGAEIIAFPALAVAAPQESDDRDEVDDETVAANLDQDSAPPSRWWAGAGLLLAALLVGALVWSLGGDERAALDTPERATADAPDERRDGVEAPEGPTGLPNPALSRADHWAAAPSTREVVPVAILSPAAVTVASINVFASDAAQWSLSDGPEYELLLRSGAVLVEFVGDGSESLMLRTADWSVQVVGTSFYAAADGELDVRVHTGVVDVRVTSAHADLSSGDAQRVVAGEALAGTERRTLTETERDAFSRWIDPASHGLALEQRRSHAASDREARADTEAVAAAAPIAGRTARARTQTPHAEGAELDSEGAELDSEGAEEVEVAANEGEAAAFEPALVLAGARGAQRTRNWREAADYYEVWLSQSAASSQAGAVRLDVARIYLDRLSDPFRAMGHLEAFVTQFPDDVAAPAARAELCRIAMSMGREVATCAP